VEYTVTDLVRPVSAIRESSISLLTPNITGKRFFFIVYGVSQLMSENPPTVIVVTVLLVLSTVGVGAVGGQEAATAGTYLVETSDGEQFCVSAIESAENVSQFYGQQTVANDSRGGDTGLEKPETASLFLHQDTTSGNLSLVFLHGSPNETELRRADYRLSGFEGLSWLVKDDPESFPYDSYASENGTLTGVNWRWERGFDGGAVGPLGDQFNLSIDATTHEVSTWRVIDSDKSVAGTAPVGGSVQVRAPAQDSDLCGASDDNPTTLPLIAFVIALIVGIALYIRRRTAGSRR
jgi:hypothetical protein